MVTAGRSSYREVCKACIGNATTETSSRHQEKQSERFDQNAQSQREPPFRSCDRISLETGRGGVVEGDSRIGDFVALDMVRLFEQIIDSNTFDGPSFGKRQHRMADGNVILCLVRRCLQLLTALRHSS